MFTEVFNALINGGLDDRACWLLNVCVSCHFNMPEVHIKDGSLSNATCLIFIEYVVLP